MMTMMKLMIIKWMKTMKKMKMKMISIKKNIKMAGMMMNSKRIRSKTFLMMLRMNKYER